MVIQKKISILSLNVRGLRNQVKRRSIFSYLKDQNCQIYLLQETFSLMMNRYGRVSGEASFSFLTGQSIVRECLFSLTL